MVAIINDLCMERGNSLSDAQLIVSLKAGDIGSYTTLYNRYFRLLYGYAYKKLWDKELAKDLIQNFFVTLWIKRTEITIDHSVSGYFFTVVNRRIADHFLHKGVEEKYVESLSAFIAEPSQPDHLIREKQLTYFINAEIQALPSRMREVFRLSRNEHLSHKEIAQRMGIAESTVNRQVSNALSLLKSRLDLVSWIMILIYFFI
jgi:RNA polymerase sigma-70 factor (ECF subfamily)